MVVQLDHPDWVSASSTEGVFADVFTGPLAPGASTPILDVTPFESLTVYTTAPNHNGVDITVIDADSNQALVDITTPPDVIGITIDPTTIPLNAGRVTIQNNGPDGITLVVSGSNRLAPARVLRNGTFDIDELSATGAPLTAGTHPMGYLRGYGAVYTEFIVTGAAVKGLFVAVTELAQMDIADTTEMVANASGNQQLHRMWIAPVNRTAVSFLCTVAGNATVLMRNI